MENIYNNKQCFSCTTNTLTHVSLSIAYSRRSDCGEGTNRREQEKQGGPGWVGSESEGWFLLPSPSPSLAFYFFPLSDFAPHSHI